MKSQLRFCLILSFCMLHLPSLLNAQNTITTDSVLQTSTCAGQTVIISFDPQGSFGFGNVFTAELSDAGGNFSNPDTIGSTFIPFLNFILGELPGDLTLGFNYKVRVVSSNPEVIGSESPNSIIITNFPGLRDASMSPDYPVCEGNEVTLSGNWGGSSYEWSNGDSGQEITVTQSGTYYLTVTDFIGCEYVSDPLEVVLWPLPDSPSVDLVSGQLHSSDAFAWQWFLDGNAILPGNEQYLSIEEPGSYTVMVTDEHGCQQLSSPYVIDSSEFLQVFPIPFQNELNIRTGFLWDDFFGYALYSAHGQRLHYLQRDKYTGSVNLVINLEDLAEGFYILEVNYRGRPEYFNLVKQR